MSKNIIITILALALVLIIGIGIGYQANQDKTTLETVATKPSNDIKAPAPAQNVYRVQELVSYQLPSGWLETSCSGDEASIYFATDNRVEVDCSASPDSQIKLSVSTETYTECSQIPEQQDVKKHICISKYINNLRSLKADTEFLSTSAYGKETEVQTYYIAVGTNIIKAQYVHADGSTDQIGFDSLVNSIKSK